VASLVGASTEVSSGSSSTGLEEDAPLLESTVGIGSLSMLMTFLGSGIAEEEGFGGTTTSGVMGMEAGEGLSFFFWGLFPATLLHDKKSKSLGRF
jgi:hypothetical protein